MMIMMAVVAHVRSCSRFIESADRFESQRV